MAPVRVSGPEGAPRGDGARPAARPGASARSPGHAAGVLETRPPRVPPEEAARVAAREFGFEGAAVELGSERDQTFRIEADGARAVLKLSNSAETAEVLDMETLAALHALRADPGLPLARPLPLLGRMPREGAAAFRARIETPRGPHFARLFEYRTGRPGVAAAELDAGALREYGAVSARLGRALRAFFHPAAGRALLWDLAHAAELRPLTTSIGDGARRALVLRALDRLEAGALRAWPRLRAQVVHGDLTLDNALVDERGRISGIVDLGDMSHTALLCDVAAALASALAGRAGDEAFRAARLWLDGYASHTPLEEEELALLPDLLAARLAAALAIAAWRAQRFPERAAYDGNGDAELALLAELDALGAGEAARRLGAAGRPASDASLLCRRRERLGPALSAPSYDAPLHLVRGEGVWLVDAGGRRHLDAYNNVPVVGHCHPRVGEAIARQTRCLATNARYLYEPLVELAERIVASMPPGSGLDTVMLVSSGSEANDLAWRLATAFTGRAGGIATANAYHGVTAAIADLSPEAWPRGYRPRHVETIPAPGAGPAPSQAEAGSRAAVELDAAVDRLAARGVAPAALFLDPAFTSDGIAAPPPASLAEIVRRAREAGALVVADEVQAGYGRCGAGLWSFPGAGIAPDFATLGKPMGNGFPVAALVTRREIAERFAETGELFHTFGGNPVACAAGLAVLDVIEDEDLVARAGRVGAALRAGLEGLRPRHAEIVDVRGRGLLLGVELGFGAGRAPDPGRSLAARVANRLRQRGVLVGTTGPRDDVLKIRPPLVIADDEAALVVSALDAALSELAAGHP
jgi:4-aminobutyrate aminotransferase-like enzyme/Ser/Thr protein kinase RdoA (MazF antagonist)